MSAWAYEPALRSRVKKKDASYNSMEPEIEGLFRQAEAEHEEPLVTYYVNPRRLGLNIVSNQELDDLGSTSLEGSLYFTLLGISSGALITCVAALAVGGFTSPFVFAGFLATLLVSALGTIGCGALSLICMKKSRNRITLIKRESAARETETETRHANVRRNEMKRIVSCLVFVLLFVGITNAQTKSMSGTVIDVEYGNRWAAIVIKVGNKKYFVQTSSAASPADPRQEVAPTPKIVGRVEEVGRKVQVFYKKITPSSDRYDGDVQATRIVEVKKSKSKRQ